MKNLTIEQRMESAYYEKSIWGNVIQIIFALREGLQSDDVEMKHLCLVVICHHLDQMEKEIDLLPSDLLVAQDAKVILQQLVQRFQTPLSS